MQRAEENAAASWKLSNDNHLTGFLCLFENKLHFHSQRRNTADKRSKLNLTFNSKPSRFFQTHCLGRHLKRFKQACSA